MAMKVSVIVPVFRVPGGMLAECLDSLEGQTLEDIEIICVLDGPDGAARRLLEERARADARIGILQSGRNRGVSAARNLGLEAVRGDWFAFVDADDWVEPTFAGDLLEAAEAGGAALASCAWRRHPPAPGEDSAEGAAGTLDFGCPEDLVRAMALVRNGSCWGRLFSRGRFGHLRFDEDLRHGEDLVYLQKAMDCAGKMACVPRALYVYRMRDGSASRKAMSLDAYANWLCALERRLAVSRRLLADNPAARRLLAWDTVCAFNDPRLRRAWKGDERNAGWMATRRFLEAVEKDFAVLPADVRAVWRWESFSRHGFFHRPRCVNAWMWYRARRALRCPAGGRSPGKDTAR